MPYRLGPPSASSSAIMSASLRSSQSRRSLSGRNADTTSTSSGHDKELEEEQKKPLVIREGRPYLSGSDDRFIYPLPVDLTETNRYIMLDLLTSAVFETPFVSPELLQNPPRRVLEVGCDSGYWSAVCHQYFQSRGHQVSFIGIDIKPPAVTDGWHRGMGMDWEFIQWDLREPGWPVQDGSIDLVMAKNLVLIFDETGYSHAISEYVRVLRPGGYLEVAEHDFAVRSVTPRAQIEENGLYQVGKTVSLGPCVNPYVAEYNIWLKSAFEALGLTQIPSALSVSLLAGCLVKDADRLERVVNKRWAVPFAPLKWEREGERRRVLTGAQAAIRQAALGSFISMVEALEPVLRRSHQKNDDEWQEWLERAKRDWVLGDGLSLGECLEFGALSLRKRE